MSRHADARTLEEIRTGIDGEPLERWKAVSLLIAASHGSYGLDPGESDAFRMDPEREGVRP